MAPGPDQEFIENAYPQFVVNRALSYAPDSFLHVMRLNEFPFSFTNRMHFEYCRLGLPKGKRFSPWGKPKKPDPEVLTVKAALGCSLRYAELVRPNVSPEQLQVMKADTFEGGPTETKTKRKVKTA